MTRKMVGMLTAAVLLVGILGVAVATHAQGPAVPSATASSAPAMVAGGSTPGGAAEDKETAGKAPDVDQVEEQLEERSAAEMEKGGQDVGPDQGQPAYTGSVKVRDPEPAELGKLAKITVDEAKAAAVEANPGTTAVKVELDNENGYLVYSVELSSGADVKVDAGTGKVLHTEQPGADDQQESVGEAETK